MRCFSRADYLVSSVEPTWTRLVASDQPVIRTVLFFCAASSVSPVEPMLTNVFSSDQPVIYTVLPREFLSFKFAPIHPPLVAFSVLHLLIIYMMHDKPKRVDDDACSSLKIQVKEIHRLYIFVSRDQLFKLNN